MPVPGRVYQEDGPSCFDKVKMGCLIGFSIGMASGAVFGGVFAMRTGLKGREFVNTMGKTMAQVGLTLGACVAIGSVLRC